MPRMTHWLDRVYFSVAHDGEVARVSGFDDRSQEHFTVIEAGRGYRDRRAQALEALQQSIEAGDPVGELSE